MHTMPPQLRRRRITRAIQDLNLRRPDPAIQSLIERLKQELEAMDSGMRELPDCVSKTLDWLNGIGEPQQLLEEVRQDPLNEYDGQEPLSDFGIAETILRLRNELAGGQFDHIGQLQDLGPNTDVIIDDLLYTGCTREAVPPSPPPDVGVLLPVRLETRFYPPQGAGDWILRVLVVPDEPSFDRHDPMPTSSELDSVEWLWQNSPGGLASAQGRVAWQQFAARHGGSRAAWLARTFPPLPPDANGVIHVARPAQIRVEPVPSRIRDFPKEIELWMARGGTPRIRVAQSSILVERLLLDFPDPTDPNDQRWWNSWDEAKAVGLGIEINLGAGSPHDIDVLYVIGLGEAEPTGLFEAHRDRGALGLIEPGTPTNTIDGAPAANLATDPEIWRQIALNPDSIGWGSGQVSLALTGKVDRLRALPGDTFAHRETAQQLVQALWMALWGHSLKDIWNLGEDVFLAGLWAGQFLAPEGPLPPVRISDNPYGLLPTTSLRGFKSSSGDANFTRFENQILPWIIEARALWAQAAESSGNISGADTERLLTLLGRTPSTSAYAYRFFVSIELLQLLYFAFDGGLDFFSLQGWWDETANGVKRFPVEPVRRYASVGWPQDLNIPLVAPEDVARDSSFGEYLQNFFDPTMLVEGSLSFWMDVSDQQPFHRLPESLLARLLLFARFIVSADVYRAAHEQFGSVLEPLGANEQNLTRLAADALKMSDSDLNIPSWRTDLYHQLIAASHSILALPIGELDRVLRAVLDTAIFRIDPWVTAFAWHRLQDSIAAAHPFHVGIYGWVDSPRPGTPGPTEAGLLHAPSESQAITAAILRDRAIHDPQSGRWDMNLESSTIRLAQGLSEEVRLGAHIGEVLGREVERIAGTRSAVEALRVAYPLRTEHAGRRVCDGQAVLQADPATLPLTADQLQKLQPLRRALDTYSDLLVAEAVYHVVAGRGAVAGAAMEAAAGLSVPPDLEVISTQRTGRGLNTNVVVLLPTATDPDATSPDASPGQIAEPAVSAFLRGAIGPGNASPWRWHVLIPEVAPGVQTQDMFLSDAGLTPIDTLALSSEDLVRLILSKAPTGAVLDTGWQVQHPSGSVQTVRLSDLNLTPGDVLSLTERDVEKLVLDAAPAGSALLGIIPEEGSRAQQRARRLNEILGRQPAVPADLVDTGLIPDDTAVRTELQSRYGRLRNVATLLKNKLDNVVNGTDLTSPQDALILASRWGITPVIQVDDTELQRVQRASGALQERIDRSPQPVDITNLDAPHLAAAIAELAMPEGQLAVLSRVHLPDIATDFTAEPQLDAEWLTVNATVREPLARLEAHQIDAMFLGVGNKFETWTNRPNDPWQVNVPVSATGAKPATRLIAIYGTAAVMPATPPADHSTLPTVAAGLLDSWGETVPDVDQSTTAAFGFNAPAARAPQAILIAVPPNQDEALTLPTLVEILAETRELAHARMATPAEISSLAAALPLILLPASGSTDVSLDPTP